MAYKTDSYRKTDLDSAYRQINANAITTSTCIAIVDNIAFLYLCLTFGIAPAPEEYKITVKAAIDLGNNLLRDES